MGSEDRFPLLSLLSRAPSVGLLAAVFGFVLGCSGTVADADSLLTPENSAVKVAAAPASGDGEASGSLRELCLPAIAKVDAHTSCSRDDSLDHALTTIAFDRCSFGVNGNRALAAPSAARPAWLAGALESPLSFTNTTRDLGRSFDDALASATPVARALLAARSVSAASAGECFTMGGTTLGEALRARGLVTASNEAKATAALAGVPPELDSALASIVIAIADAQREVAGSLPADAPSRASLENTVDWMMWSAPRAPTDADVAIAAKVDLGRMTRAAARLAFVIESVGLRRFRGMALAAAVVPTTIGDLVLRGPGSDVDDGNMNRVALWIDTGGSDVYRGTSGAATKTQSVSVLVDLDGTDRYGYAETDSGSKTRLAADARGRLASGRTASRVPRQGGALFGVGLAFDYGDGNDTYRSLALSQGAGAFGVGVLFDEGGADDAAAETVAQGAAIAGVGLFLDGGGDDARHLFARGQAYGAWGGVGVLVDASGNDRYRADPGDARLGGELLYPSDLLSDSRNGALPKGNHNAVQGFGEGRRGLAGTMRIAAGGLGLLRDRAGSDRYEAGAFAQGSALEEGAGVLLDGSGDDHYDGLAYVQGAGLHRAFGALVDEGGNDAYDATFPIVQTSLAVGHDYGVGVVVDLGGNDSVVAPTLSLGSASANGAGLFVATGGEDTFAAATKAAFGASLQGGVTGDRKKEPTVGVFVKASGTGAYRVAGKTVGRTGSLWHATEGGVGHGGDKTVLRSVGLDAPSGRVAF